MSKQPTFAQSPKDVLFARACVALERIAAALELATAVPSEPESTACLHPADQRIDFGVTNGVEDWQCRACGFRTVEATT